MVNTATRQLGEYIGNLSYEQEQTKSNLSPNDPYGFDQRAIISNVALEGTIIATKYTIATNSFVLDHLVYGELDSSTLTLDGGYSSSTTLYTTTF